jgi:MFS family permease
MAEPGPLAATAAVAALLFGFLPALPGGIRGPLAERFGVKPEQAGTLAALLTLGMVIFMPLAGILADHWGVPGILAAGSLAAAVGATGLALGQTPGRARAAMLLLGAGSAGLGVGACVLMARAFFADNPLAGAQIGTFFLAAGTLLGPPLAAKFLRKAGFRQGLLIIALAALLPGLLAAWPGGPQPSEMTGGMSRGLGSPELWLVGCFFLLCLPLEATLTGSANDYMLRTGHGPALASALAAGFLVAFLLTRLGTGILMGQTEFVFEDPEPWAVLLLALFLAIVLGNMTTTDRPRGAALGLLLAGATLAPMLPLVLGLTLRLFPSSRGTACGAVWAVGLLGEMLLLPVFRKYARRPETHDPLRITVAPALLMAIVALVLALVRQLE